MINYIKKHPSLIRNQDIKAICSPLKKLQIDYFAHVLVTKDHQFSAIATNAGFTEHYFKNKYYNVDLHMTKTQNIEFVIWDMLELCGLSAKMHNDAALFGFKHTFTIIENNEEGRHYYHFANSGESLSINQTYLANYDLLKAFIPYFKKIILSSKELAMGHQLKFKISSTAKGYQTSSVIQTINTKDQEDYLRLISPTPNYSQNIILLNKKNNESVKLTKQQSKCMSLLAAGHSNKNIALTMGLSIRTVQHYLDRVRYLVGCQTSKELISLYHIIR